MTVFVYRQFIFCKKKLNLLIREIRILNSMSIMAHPEVRSFNTQYSIVYCVLWRFIDFKSTYYLSYCATPFVLFFEKYAENPLLCT